MPTTSLSPDALHRLLSRRDLTNPREGVHAMQPLVREIHEAAARRLDVPRRVCRLPPVRRHVAATGEPGVLRLRQDLIEPPPEALDVLEPDTPDSVLLVCLGPVVGRAGDGRAHLHGHRLSLWLLDQGGIRADCLPALVQTALRAAVPGHHYRLLPRTDGASRSAFSVEVNDGRGWERVGACGIAAHGEGEAAGVILELEPLLVLRKQLPDASLIHAPDREVQSRMRDLEPYPTSEEQCRAEG